MRCLAIFLIIPSFKAPINNFKNHKIEYLREIFFLKAKVLDGDEMYRLGGEYSQQISVDIHCDDKKLERV